MAPATRLSSCRGPHAYISALSSMDGLTLSRLRSVSSEIPGAIPPMNIVLVLTSLTKLGVILLKIEAVDTGGT